MTDTYEERIFELRIEAEERQTLRYPQAFRDKAVELVCELRAEGWTQASISEGFEIPWATLGRWCDDATSGDEAKKMPEGFRPVEVLADSHESSRVALVAPSGWRIEGLTVAEAVEAVGRLQ